MGWINATVSRDIENVQNLNQEIVESKIPVLTIFAVFTVVGLIGNSAVLYIYSRRYPKCNFKYFILILAAIDTVSCVVLMPLEIVTFVHWFVYPSAALCKFKSALKTHLSKLAYGP